MLDPDSWSAQEHLARCRPSHPGGAARAGAAEAVPGPQHGCVLLLAVEAEAVRVAELREARKTKRWKSHIRAPGQEEGPHQAPRPARQSTHRRACTRRCSARAERLVCHPGFRTNFAIRLEHGWPGPTDARRRGRCWGTGIHARLGGTWIQTSTRRHVPCSRQGRIQATSGQRCG